MTKLSPMRRGFQTIAVFCIAGMVLGGGLAVGERIVRAKQADEYSFFDELVEVKQALSQRYVELPDDKALSQGAIKGMVEALGDPYTVYVPAAEKRSFNKDLTGEYVGIGAQVNQQEGWLVIVTPLEDSPAFRAGLMAEDRVVEIDGKSTQNLSIDECIDLLMGEPGTTVNVVIERKGEKMPLQIRRDRIKTRSVKGYHRSAGDANEWDYLIDQSRKIAYVRLTQFTPGCARELAAALRSVGAEKGELKGLVLDLRFNPGGLLNEAEEIADLFLESGVIVSTRGRAHEGVTREARKPGTLPNFPVAVLLSPQSASASEVLSGALVENNRAIVVGQRSYGKGSVQSVIELASGKGSELKITEQGYFLPTGRSITRKDDSATWGVDPSDGFYVPMSDEELVEMIEVRRREEVLHAQGANHPPSGDWSSADAIVAGLKDKQLAAAVKAVQIKIDSGEWQPTGEKGPQGTLIATSELTKAREYRDRLEREMERTEKRMAALESSDPAAAAAPVKDLWADNAELKGGTIEIKDKDGKVIATLEVTGNNVEPWLLNADVKKKE